ncbi:RagB/SusD family nutrient uptake outer membrane protein [Solitalea lacus]|uniref:RagB/SusD family nutrient uptake outer membrane protein n=1 Tax=Solitalea lacus TaxID=2911172 RepID=UPI001EDC2B90|nr:RagB/SusD family nutrient uptake outer membrane protein [Solitalea lacus]UKJ09248.1 RagB/SusD family nutrient uptake outer membrane protein [Solitalea lacus]
MKNKTIYGILGLPLIALLIGGCSQYFEVNPDMRTELNTADKVGQLLVTAYPTSDYLLFTEAASDYAIDRGPGSYSRDDIARESYLWTDIPEMDGKNTPNTYWLAMYRTIAAANQAIEAVDDNNFGVKGQQYKGEALLCRAYAHFMLVSIFSKAYHINGDNSSMGIPYLTVPEKVAFKDYDRGTVASVYENIEKDLVEGMKLIKGLTFKSPKFHFNMQAANAFAARFYLFKGDYDKVIEYSSAIFPENNFRPNLRPVGTRMKNNSNTFTPIFTGTQENFNLLLTNVTSSFAMTFGSSRYGFGKDARRFLDTVTVAGKPFSNYFLTISGTEDKLLVAKYTTNTPTTVQCLFSADEALMNRAEAYINKGNYELALNDLNDFAAVRIVNYDAGTDVITESKVLSFYKTTDLKEGLMKTLLDFKKQGFVQEGIRWFDINRLGIEIIHRVYNDNYNATYDVLKKDDLRRVFQLPPSVTLSGLPKNPR